MLKRRLYRLILVSICVPPGVLGIWGGWLFILGSWGALVIIKGELGSKLIILGI